MIIKPYLEKFKKKDGTQRVYIYLYSDSEKETIATEFFVKASDWDGWVKKSRANFEYINASIRETVSKIENIWLKDQKLTPREVKRLVIDPKDSAMSIPAFIDWYVAGMRSGKFLNKGKPFAKASCDSHERYSKHVVNFIDGQRIGWNDVNEDFYNKFSSYLRNDLGFMENTIARAIKVLKKNMRVARKEKLHSNSDFEGFHAAYTDTDSIYLTESEVEDFGNAKVEKHLVEDQDRFIISYNLFLRFGDGINIDKNDIFETDGRHFIRFMQSKAKHKPVIPLFPKTLDLLKKYNYKLPPSTNQESNRNLKEIGKVAEINSIFTQTFVKAGELKKRPGYKYLFITTHTARRSMATNYYLSMRKHGNIDLKSLQLMGGWKSIAMLEKYLKIGALENALDAVDHPFFNRGSGTPIPPETEAEPHSS